MPLPMSFSPNFVSVKLRTANGRERLIVQGVTEGDPDALKDIYVGLAHGKRNLVPAPRGDAAGADRPVALQPEGKIRSAAQAEAPNGVNWKATIAQESSKVKRGEKVVVIGAAVPVSTRARPFFWHQTLTVE
jgi:hypothetical protein